MLLNQISQYGCCFNTIVGESTGRRYENNNGADIQTMMCLSIRTAMYFMIRLIMQFLLETYTVYVEYHLVDFVLRCISG